KSNPREGYILGDFRFVPIQIIDVAGLVEGAHQGKGLGLEFLNDLNQADLLIHIVDISGSTNEKGEPVPPMTHDPTKDILFLENELDHWHFNILKKGWEKFVKTINQDNQNIKAALAKQLSGLKITEETIEDSIKELRLTHHPSEWSDKDLFDLASLLRKKTKPILIAANKIDIQGSEMNLHKLQKNYPGLKIISCSAESELALKEAAKHNLIKYTPGESSFEIISKSINEKQKKALEFIKSNVLDKHKTTGVQDILNKAVFEYLQYIAVFPVATNHLTDKEGRLLPDCYLVPNNTTTGDFAYKIHSDLGKNFIRAIDVRTKRTIGKDYNLKHMDIIEIIAGK
ncbi:MAG: YchF-related putative GTPase, partial [Nanoarchaeota archaeon]